MSVEEEFDTVSAPVERDHRNRPWVIQQDGSRKTYARASSVAKALAASWKIDRWEMVHMAIGFVRKPELLMGVSHALSAGLDEKEQYNQIEQIVEQALDAGGGNAAADRGTGLHGLTQLLDEGRELVGVPIEYLPGIAAYKEITRWFRLTAAEFFGVCDEVQAAGSWDRLAQFIMPDDPDAPKDINGKPEKWPFPFELDTVRGVWFVWDLKTTQTKSLAHKWTSWAVQLAIYSRCSKYYPDRFSPEYPHGGHREPLQVSQTQAIVCNQPSGGDTATLYWVDIEQGWQYVLLAQEVMALGVQRKHLKTAFHQIGQAPPVDPVIEAIQNATSYEGLAQVFRRVGLNHWTPQYQQLALARRQQIEKEA